MKKVFTNFRALIFFSLIASVLCGEKMNSLNMQEMAFYSRIPSIFGLSSLISGDQIMEKRPVFLYKVLSVEDWAKSQKTVHLSSMDAEFIHLATEDQLSSIIAKYWADVPRYIVLKLEVSKLSGNLVYEANPGGMNKYYHLYNGNIPLSSIVKVEKI